MKYLILYGACYSVSAMIISANGIQLNVEVTGEGPPVLLLHGFPDSLRMWDEVTPQLVSAGFQVIAFDQRGFGQSYAPQAVSDYKVRTIVEDAIGLLERLAINEKVRLIGHDWGALIGWKLAIEHPHLIESFIAISVGHPNSYRTAGFEQKKKGWYVLAFQLRGIAELMMSANNFGRLRKLSSNQKETERWITDLSRKGRLTAALNWYRANFSELLMAPISDCMVPVMGVFSTGDVALTEEQMTNSKKYVQNFWRYERVENCGHWIPTEEPDLLSQLIIDWFNNCPRPV